jgi:hypothetical protein
MLQDNPTIIADTSAPPRRLLSATVCALAVVLGLTAALMYARADLTLSHYDARAHLTVARRVVDSLTPGWRQFGGVWLPLPHVLNLVPVQWDWAYRTGAAAVAISIAALAWGLTALAGFLYRETRSAAVAVAAPLAVLLNPNVLYLQSTPMTEPLLIGGALLAVAAVGDWLRAPDARLERRAGLVLAALVLIRYEGWLIAAALLALAAIGLITRRETRRRAAYVLDLSLYPLVAIVLFLFLSWGSTGTWFQRSGFFVPDNPTRGQLGATIEAVWRSTLELAGPWLIGTALAGVVVSLWKARRSSAALLPLALVAAALLPMFAFYQGHPHRVRYMVPLVAAAGALAGLAFAAIPARLRSVAGIALFAVVLADRVPWSPEAPMVKEAQWETPYRLARQHVTAVLRDVHGGDPILASMGSLGHYMQESARAGFDLADFLHEGNGDLWTAALAAPRRHVRWMLIEEHAEGGDMLAMRARENPEFLDGFTRVADGGGLVLYVRVD